MTRLRGVSAAVAALGVFVLLAGFLSGCISDLEELEPSMSIVPGSVTMVEGRWRDVEVRSNLDLCVWNLGWGSADYAIALADSVKISGDCRGIARIRAVGPGTTNVSFGVTAADKSASAELSVTVTPVSIHAFSVSPDTSTIAIEESCTIVPHATDSTGWELVGQPVIWEVADTSVATLLLVWGWYYSTEPASSALFQGKKVGETTVTATVEGHSASAVIRVVEP